MFTCSFTGHRVIPHDKLEYVKAELYAQVISAVEDGFINFMSGFADGADLEFAHAVIRARESYPFIKLIAVLPFEKRLGANNAFFQRLIKKSDKIIFASPEYSRECFALRNKRMVEESQRLVAVYDGRERSGTAQTLRMAEIKGVETRVIFI